jgi:two-component system chemotaxis response regulator CheY
MGYSEIIESADGDEALQAFGPSIRCVITDWDLPQVSGLDVIRTLRSRPDGQSVPIMMMTTRSTREDVQTAHRAGASTYLLRPFTLEAFKQKLEAALRPTR